MSWQCIELTVNQDRQSYFSDMFDAFNALSVTTTAADESLIFEIDGKANDSWQRVKVTGMFDSQMDLDPFLKKLSEFDDLEINAKRLEDCDWERAWLDHFKPQKISEKLWICPSWTDPADPPAVTVTIDPGMSFGTGTHASTRLCLSWLCDLDLDHKNVIDYGCGTGILAIAAIKLGARYAVATDIEPRSLAISRENAARNHVSDALTTCLPDEMSNAQADLVIANILAGTIIELAAQLSGLTKSRGQLLLAGILRSQVSSIKEALREFEWQCRYEDDWVAMLGNRI